MNSLTRAMVIPTPPATKKDAGRGDSIIKNANNADNFYVILYLDENNITRATTFNTYDAKQAHDYIKLLNPDFNMIAITNGKIYQE